MTTDTLKRGHFLHGIIEELSNEVAKADEAIKESTEVILWNECTKAKFTLRLGEDDDSNALREIFNRKAVSQKEELERLQKEFAAL